ncbi:hypothetical protein MRY82_00135 [bacterium]|nr:hypothetical protein [bacterium]
MSSLSFAQGSPSWDGASISNHNGFLPLGGSTKPYNGYYIELIYTGKSKNYSHIHYGWTWVYNDAQKTIRARDRHNGNLHQWKIEIDTENPDQFIYGENENQVLIGRLEGNNVNLYLQSCVDQCEHVKVFSTNISTFKG